jgi:pullulanase
MFDISTKETLSSQNFDQQPEYPHAHLWPDYSPQATRFILWSPVAGEVVLNLYEKGDGENFLERHYLQESEKGLWSLSIPKDLKGIYYTFQVKIAGKWLQETPGIYARAVGVNGQRAMVTDLPSTNPDGWEQDKGPSIQSPNEAVLYELHIRDMTQHINAGSSMRGKYPGLVEKGTRSHEGLSTGIDHLKELGITHVHLLPAFDHRSIDESRLDQPQYNWGYDPLNYNVPEGSYASDPYKAEVRIKEFKQMVKGFHDEGIGVILDVVYNHTGLTEDSYFNREFPGYYYRHTPDGHWSDASGCGNETASERPMMRKFIIESCKYWVSEYHIDGFRFDLMGIHDIETMNLLSIELRKIKPDILIYGEGWTAGASPLPADKQAIKANTPRLKHIAAFSDDMRDGMKGSVFEEKSRGFVNGGESLEETVKFGVAGCTAHPQLDFSKINYCQQPWAREPWQSISYVSCHDNHTLFDKLNISTGGRPEDTKKMQLLANAVVLTAQGIPFLHAGVEMMRTKHGEHNSYNLPDSINQIDWSRKAANQDVFSYYRDLIALRKAHPAFRMPTAEMLAKHLKFSTTAPGLIGYLLKDHANHDSWKNIAVYYNARHSEAPITLKGEWYLAVEGTDIIPDAKRKVKDKYKVAPLSMLILYQE